MNQLTKHNTTGLLEGQKLETLLAGYINRIKMWTWKTVLYARADETGSEIRCTGSVRLGGTRYVKIGSRTCFGKNVVLHTEGRGYIHIGTNVKIGDGVRISSRSSITIEDNTVIEDNTSISDFQEPARSRSVYIGKDVLIERDVTIRAGITLGQRVRIKAGSVVEHSVPPGEVFSGVTLEVA